MKASAPDVKYEYILNLLKSAGEEHQAILDRIFSENTENQRSFLFILRKNLDYAEETLSPTWAYRMITDTVSSYIHAYCGPASAKQLVCNALYELCKTLGAKHNIPDHAMYLEDLPKPVEEDVVISIIKALHNQEGISKEELRAKYGVDPKTIQNYIYTLSGKRASASLRIGGFAVKVPVECHKEVSRRQEPRKYYTPNTLNPVVLQMNTIQTATLLQSFYYNHKKGNVIPLDMAIDVWSQLSNYTKKRIRDIFCKKDQAFSVFIEQIDTQAQSLSYQFTNETDMLRTGDISLKEQLLIAEKGGLICDICLANPVRSLKKQRIYYDNTCGQYYALPADGPTVEKLYLFESELEELVDSL